MDTVMSWADHPVVDVRPDDRTVRRRVVRSVRLGLAMARIWWPLWLPTLALRLAGLPTLGAVTLTVAVDAAAGWRWRRVRAKFRRMPLASAGAWFRLKWPTLCAQTGITGMVNGSLRCPRLLEVDFGGPWWRFWRPEHARLQVEPLGIQDEEAWPKMARRIARQLHFATVTALPADELLDIYLYRARLPNMIRLGADVPASALTPEPGVVALGLSSLGGPIRWAWDEPTRTSIAIGGGTGGGKGDAINKILGACRNLILAGEHVEVIVLDPKGIGDFLWARSFALVLQDPVSMCRALAHVRAEMDRRRDFMNRREAGSWADLEPADQARLGRLVLIIDEFVTLANRNVEVALPGDESGSGKGAAKGVRTVNLMAQALTDLQEITATSRAMRINVIVATQHFIADTIPGKFGSTVMANLGARIGLGSLEVGGATTLFGKANAESIAARSRAKVPGRMFYSALSDDGAEHGPIIGQSWWAHPGFLRELRATNPTVTHRDVMAEPDRTPIGAEDLTDRPTEPGLHDDDLAEELHQLTGTGGPVAPAPASGNHHDQVADDTQADRSPAAVLVDDPAPTDPTPAPEAEPGEAIDTADETLPAPVGPVLLPGGWDGRHQAWHGLVLGRPSPSQPTGDGQRHRSLLGPVVVGLMVTVLVAVSTVMVGSMAYAGWLWGHGGLR